MKAELLQVHNLIRRIQQKNRFVGQVKHTGLSLIETHFIIELQALSSRSIKDLSELLGVDSSFGSKIVKAFASRSLLKITQNPDDSRKKLLKITKKGEALIRKIDSYAAAFLEESFHSLSKDELKLLVKGAKAIADAYDHPEGIKRDCESQYRVEQRRVTRALGMLNENIFGTNLSSSQWQTLAEVVLTPVPPQISELAELLSLAQNSLSTVIDSLEKQRFLKRVRSAKDRRVFTLEALPAGVELIRTIEAQVTKKLKQAFSSFSQDELEQFVRILKSFVGISNHSWPFLLADYSVSENQSTTDRDQSRAFVARLLVEQGLEQLIPEHFVSANSRSFILYQGEKKLALLEVGTVKKKSLKINFAAWSRGVSPWIIAAFVNRVHFLLEGSSKSNFDGFVAYGPLQEFLDCV